MSEQDALPVLQHYSKEELAYRELRSAILAGVLKPCERLLPRELAIRFNVSTMPVRQALSRLEGDRLVQRIPNRGLTVAPLSAKDVEEIYTIRAVLEGLAARLATFKLSPRDVGSLAEMVEQMESVVVNGSAERLDEINTRFHFTIYGAVENDRLFELLRNLWDVSLRYRRMYYAQPGVPAQTLREHRGILAALRGKDPALAEELVRADMEETARVLISLVREDLCIGG